MANRIQDGTWVFYNCIVGYRFHTGRVNGGDQVLLEREPNNPVDPNAIVAKIITEPHTVIGYIPARTAAILAPWIDKNKFEIVKTQVARTFKIDIVRDNVPIPIEITLSTKMMAPSDF